VVTDAAEMDVSIATILPGARSARISLLEPRSGNGKEAAAVELALEPVAGKLAAGQGAFPVTGFEGGAKFRAEIFGGNGETLGTSEFTTELAGSRYAEIRQNLQTLETRLAAIPEAAEEAQRVRKAGVSFWLQCAKTFVRSPAQWRSWKKEAILMPAEQALS